MRFFIERRIRVAVERMPIGESTLRVHRYANETADDKRKQVPHAIAPDNEMRNKRGKRGNRKPENDRERRPRSKTGIRHLREREKCQRLVIRFLEQRYCWLVQTTTAVPCTSRRCHRYRRVTLHGAIGASERAGVCRCCRRENVVNDA